MYKELVSNHSKYVSKRSTEGYLEEFLHNSTSASFHGSICLYVTCVAHRNTHMHSVHLLLLMFYLCAGLGGDGERVHHVPAEDISGQERQGVHLPQRHHPGGMLCI